MFWVAGASGGLSAFPCNACWAERRGRGQNVSLVENFAFLCSSSSSTVRSGIVGSSSSTGELQSSGSGEFRRSNSSSTGMLNCWKVVCNGRGTGGVRPSSSSSTSGLQWKFVFGNGGFAGGTGCCTGVLYGWDFSRTSRFGSGNIVCTGGFYFLYRSLGGSSKSSSL